MLITTTYPRENVVTLTINRPEAQNAMTFDMMSDLAFKFRDLRLAATPPRAVILTGADDKAFTAGVDLTAAMQVFKSSEDDVERDVVHQMDLCPFPIIGAINGWAINAGFEIALACDLLIASPNANFMDTHCQFGLMPAWGLSQRLPRLVGANRAREVSLVGMTVNATTALVWGLVNRVVPGDGLLATAEKMAEQIANKRPEIISSYKRVLKDGMGVSMEEGRRMERARAFEHYRNMTEEDFANMKKFIQTPRSKPKL